MRRVLDWCIMMLKQPHAAARHGIHPIRARPHLTPCWCILSSRQIFYFTWAHRISLSEGATRPCRICPINRRRTSTAVCREGPALASSAFALRSSRAARLVILGRRAPSLLRHRRRLGRRRDAPRRGTTRNQVPDKHEPSCWRNCPGLRPAICAGRHRTMLSLPALSRLAP
jgi:hypothetical protein